MNVAAKIAALGGPLRPIFMNNAYWFFAADWAGALLGSGAISNDAMGAFAVAELDKMNTGIFRRFAKSANRPHIKTGLYVEATDATQFQELIARNEPAIRHKFFAVIQASKSKKAAKATTIELPLEPVAAKPTAGTLFDRLVDTLVQAQARSLLAMEERLMARFDNLFAGYVATTSPAESIGVTRVPLGDSEAKVIIEKSAAGDLKVSVC